jgi:ABC-type antimicrobial peptide transport system permease subunit
MRLTKPKDLPSHIRELENVLKKLSPANAPEVMFADENFADKYRTIELIGKLSNLFALLAIFLTALGVFGLAAYTAEQRTKEMAIRKVLGASLNTLLLLLSNYFIRIVLFAVIIAAPVSWWALDNYLQNYSYRISIPWWTIPLTSLAIFAVTLFIVFTQVIRAASINLLNSLKNE